MSGRGGTNKKDKIKDTAAVFLQLLKIDEDASLLERKSNLYALPEWKIRVRLDSNESKLLL